MHIKARLEKPAEYPQRTAVGQNQVEWDSPYQDYDPPYYVSKIVLNQYEKFKEAGWAQPENIQLVQDKIQSLVSKLQFDTHNRPLNPMGRTGLCGRGLLGKWGPNFAADAICTRTHPTTHKVEVLLIQRKDCLLWALPGGMIDQEESPLTAASRELQEEASLHVSFKPQDVMYEGYVDDPRNTDNAWMETTAFHKHFDFAETQKVKLSAGDDAAEVSWKEISPDLLDSLYASHKALILRILDQPLQDFLKN